jgi:hypothetical protein
MGVEYILTPAEGEKAPPKETSQEGGSLLEGEGAFQITMIG